jgi:hypothetical protein
MIPHVLACKSVQQQLSQKEEKPMPKVTGTPPSESPIAQLWQWQSLATDPTLPPRTIHQWVPSARWTE